MKATPTKNYKNK